MSRETKIGLLALITIALFIWGYEFLKGRNILGASQIFYAEYKNVDQLKKSNPVLINGFQVGIVKSIYQNPEDLDKILVEMDVEKGVKVPKDAVAEITTTGMMGGRAIILRFAENCSGDGCAQSGDYLKGVTKGFLTSMVGTEDVDDYLSLLQEGLASLLDTLSMKLSDNEAISGSGEDIRTIIANLRSTTTRLDRVMANSGSSIESSLENVASITGNLAASNAQIQEILANVDTISGQLKDADLKKTVGNADATLESLQNSLAGIDETISSLNSVLMTIQNSEGTLGKLINEKELYEQLQRSMQNLDFLLQDIRLHPERYRRVLSKKEMPYEKPESDPAFEDK